MKFNTARSASPWPSQSRPSGSKLSSKSAAVPVEDLRYIHLAGVTVDAEVTRKAQEPAGLVVELVVEAVGDEGLAPQRLGS